ncbi:HlyD family efflux transporter periplasmic adaptor subunit [Amphritea balenae]|uniref:HlyD family efflux transporter periplasmic adaptor subunit n=1 Tax=Amphritea balenae TaxID=452629 RepID=A0A3P1SPU7_9GAMM|nr:HlyD family efflux transporter periplasmic adaptor subunit [Amphritea balenae]RRC98665.1 HlyD family efflux transporter periplasmic adaptor subunit [Amphritea balenae]GGK66391.1 hypothetical protein GCM10007941_15750 [Amphritea balenae]
MTADDEILWQYVAELRPQLRAQVQIVVQNYRAERWYLLQDSSSGRFIRMNSSAYQVLGRLNGEYSLREILALSNQGRNEENQALTSYDVLRILAQLHDADVLKGAIPLSAQDILSRYNKNLRFRRLRALSNPLALKISLLDPDRFLNVLQPLGRFIFSSAGAVIWLITLICAVLLGSSQFQALSSAVLGLSFGSASMVSVWLLYPMIKILHELGHGLAIKTFGGEVHEAGINMLVFFPVPYVDGSAAWAFRDKYKRALVGAAGIVVELYLAAIALIIWSLVEPGVVQDMALYTFIIASISTLLFNANPLLRFDGYYVLEDLIEIPNLASRSRRFYLYLVQRYLLNINSAASPVTARGERGWFICYGLLAPFYRLFILFTIAIYLTSEFLLIGAVLAGWAVMMQIISPLYRAVMFLLTSPTMQHRRFRGGMISGLFLLLVCGGLLLPMSLTTQAQGVVWMDDNSRIVAGTSGFISPEVKPQERQVEVGDVVVQLDNPDLLVEQQVLESRLRELRTRQVAVRQESRIQGGMVVDEIRAVEAELARLNARIGQLDVRTNAAGTLVLNNNLLFQGEFISQGDLLAYVVQQRAQVIRAVIPQERIGLLGREAVTADVMFAHQPGRRIHAEIIRQVPAGSRILPSASLGLNSGGNIRLDPADPKGQTAAEDFFVIDLIVPEIMDTDQIMSRVYVRLDHGYEPVGQQLLRSLQQLFLRQLNS